MFLLVYFGYCEAEEINTFNAPEQAAVSQKQASQNDTSTLSATAYPKETTKHLLPNKRRDLLHIAFEKGYIGKGVRLEPVVLEEAFTLEVIVKPSGKQVAYAGIVGNHTPGGGLEGFVVQQVALEQNVYTMCFADGAKGVCSVKFTLKDGIWNYLAVVCNDMNSIKIYIDGNLVGSVAPINKIKNSSLPLQIGNWELQDRPFSGSIAEVRIANSTLSEKDISMRWDKMKSHLSKM
jgi:hypothetical protein